MLWICFLTAVRYRKKILDPDINAGYLILIDLLQRFLFSKTILPEDSGVIVAGSIGFKRDAR